VPVGEFLAVSSTHHYTIEMEGMACCLY